MLKSVFDHQEHENLVKQGHRKLSHKALKSAILIYVYRRDKGYGLANQILESLVDLDTIFCKWRCMCIIHLIDCNNFCFILQTLTIKYRQPLFQPIQMPFVELFRTIFYPVPIGCRFQHIIHQLILLNVVTEKSGSL